MSAGSLPGLGSITSEERLEALPEWRKFLRHFELGQGFAVIVLLVNNRAVASRCEAEFDSWLLERHRPQLLALPIGAPDDLVNLTDKLLTVAPPEGPIWVDGTGPSQLYELAWSRCAVRLNRARDTIAGRFRNPLILVGGTWIREILRDTAPDLWSVRAFTAEIHIASAPLAISPPPAPARANGAVSDFAFDPELALRAIADLRNKPGQERQLSAFLARAADGLMNRGRTEEALALAREAFELDERAVGEQPGRSDYLRHLVASYNRVGDLQQALGQGEAASQFYRQALEIGERLVNQEPGRADYLKDLAVSYSKMGDLRRNLGQDGAAVQFYSQALEIGKRLAKQEPDSVDTLRYLAISYSKMGDLQRDLGQSDAAIQCYSQSLEIGERLVKQEPGRADTLRYLAISYSKMGDLQRDLGQSDAASQFYSQALEIGEQLVKQEPGRADYQRELAVYYSKMGDLQRALGEHDAAREYYEKDLEIAEHLVAMEPGRADYQVELAYTLARMPDRASLQRGLDILLRLQGSNRLNAQDRPSLAYFEQRLAEMTEG